MSKLVPKPFSDQEIEFYRIDVPSKRRAPKQQLGFPQSSRTLRSFIFECTGFSAHRSDLSWRDWYCFNYSLNQGLGIGLPTPSAEEGSDRTLLMLSLMDTALHHVARGIGIPYLPPPLADSTAAHSKQVMNIIQNVFKKSGVLSLDNPRKPAMESLRREALKGVWVHDMGEIVFELSTAFDVFRMSPEENTEKARLEDKIFTFSSQLAAYCIDEGKPDLFIATIQKIRDAALNESVESFTLTQEGGVDKIKGRMQRIEHAIDKEIAELPDFPKELTKETKYLHHLYEQAEGLNRNDESFLYVFVKTLESLDGYRYMQRNSHVSEMQKLSQRLAGRPPIFTKADISDYTLSEEIKRVEQHLHKLFELAHTEDEQKLARATASFTYRSIARQFLPEAEDEVGLATEILDRKPNHSFIQAQHTPTAADTELKRQCLEQQKSNPKSPRYIKREDIGAIYRAAEELVCEAKFTPPAPLSGRKTAVLFNLEDTPEFPAELLARAEEIKLDPSNTTRRLFSRNYPKPEAKKTR